MTPDTEAPVSEPPEVVPPLSGDAGLLHDDNAWRRLRAGREWMTILDALEESVILEREDGSVARCNKAAAQTFRFDLHTVEGRRLTELLGEEVPFSALREPGAVVQCKTTARVLEVSNYPLEKGAPVTRWVHIFRDVTERRRLEAVAEAINVNEHLGFMVSALRHEFGNALNVAKLAASVLREDFESTLTPDMVVYVDRMNEQLGRMEYLLKLLRSYSFADVVSSEPINLCRVLMDFARLTSHDFSKRRVEVGLDLPLGVNALWVRGDPKALHQVLLNLVCNGAEAIPDDRAGRVVMRLAERGRDIVLEVEDDGVGIEAAKGSLFRPFFTTKPNGTGLGLVIVKRLLGAMGATIQLEAGPEGGAVARVTLPKAEPAPAE